MGLGSVLLLIALPGVSSFSRHGGQDDAQHVQRAIQLANARELMGADTIRLSASGLRKVDDVNLFINQYVANSLKPEWKKQAGRVSRAIIDAGLRHGFDPLLLLAVIENESQFDPTVVGTHGEIGLMQIKPDTAEWIAKKVRIRWHGADTLRDPAANIRIGSAYLSMLRTDFGFEKDLYLAAYNMGSKNVRRLLSSNGRPQVYPQKTLQHYSQIYIEFLGEKNKDNAEALAAL
jgi:soluble lytic murein transglycosylase